MQVALVANWKAARQVGELQGAPSRKEIWQDRTYRQSIISRIDINPVSLEINQWRLSHVARAFFNFSAVWKLQKSFKIQKHKISIHWVMKNGVMMVDHLLLIFTWPAMATVVFLRTLPWGPTAAVWSREIFLFLFRSRSTHRNQINVFNPLRPSLSLIRWLLSKGVPSPVPNEWAVLLIYNALMGCQVVNVVS